jgi:hypothetical protein
VIASNAGAVVVFVGEGVGESTTVKSSLSSCEQPVTKVESFVCTESRELLVRDNEESDSKVLTSRVERGTKVPDVESPNRVWARATRRE